MENTNVQNVTKKNSYRGREYFRKVRIAAIAKKMRKSSHYAPDGSYYKCKGQYSKGKIHCSCGLCKGERFSELPSKSDMNKLIAFRQQLEDYYSEAAIA